MNKASIDTDLNFGMRTLGFRSETIQKWNKILQEFNGKGVDIIEFNPKAMQNYHWGLSIEINHDEGSTEEVKLKAKSKILNRQANSQLSKAFQSNAKIVSEYWDKLFEDLRLAGFYIPLKDIYKVDPIVLRSHLNFYHLLIKHFDIKGFFADLQENLSELTDNEDKVPHAIWFYLIYYTKFLRKLKKESYSQYQEIYNWFTQLIDLEDFHQRLPSEKITILLVNQCEAMVSETDKQWHTLRMYSKASIEIEEFFKKHRGDFEKIFGENLEEKEDDGNIISVVDNISSAEQISQIQKTIKRDFVSVFTGDVDRFFIQEILDDQSKIKVYGDLNLFTQMKYGPSSIYNVSGVIKDKVFSKKQRPAGEFKEHDEELPAYTRLRDHYYPSNVQYWFDIDSNERLKLRNEIEQNSSNQKLEQANQVAQSRSRDYLLNLFNLFSAPIIFWNREGEKIFPRWNLFSDDEAKNFRNIYKHKKIAKAKEEEELKKHLVAISGLFSLDEINAYIDKHKPVFSHEKFHKFWDFELSRLKRKISNKEKFHESRMREFGIFESRLTKRSKVIWLEEMLAIENEVKPYISYVKQAFQTALPIRRKVKFSDYRHSSDGVEFDADTLYDQEKWIRADVMRVMESHTERGDAIQINTFCLDYSGSMEHDRMRNLFKMLFLLVLGLEDRKSFDSFHMFSNSFIEVANFSDSFTSRKVLFQIMRKISQINNEKVTFFGLGGTNISEGVDRSHSKMKKFVKEYQEANPLANIVSSMFVITDGEPSLGITDIDKLSKFIDSKRQDGDVEIKGIFIKSEDDVNLDLMSDIFGAENFVETTDFDEGVNKFVRIMTQTYKAQRKTFKWRKKKQKLGLTK